MGIPVVHVVSGAVERQFVERLRAHPAGYDPIVACLDVAHADFPEVLALGLPSPSLFPLRGSLLRPNTLKQIWRLSRLVRDSGARIVHGTEFVSNFMALFAGRVARVPVVVSRADLGQLRPAFGKKHRAVEKWMSRTADAVSTNADAVRRLCIEEERAAPSRVVVIPNGIDLVRFDEAATKPLQGPLPEGKPLVAVVANLWPVKGHRTLLDAIGIVRERRPEVRFALVGEGPEREWLQLRAAELGLGESISFLGSRSDVPAILARADAFCLPSLAEGLPDELMEAMAARLPVVASAVGGIPELVDAQNGFVVPPGKPELLAARLLQVLADPREAARLGEQGRRKIARDYSLARLCERQRRLYDGLLVQSRSNVGIAAIHP
jgi:glycosyltransferase involved in cell wall biosynthesis